jgi:hypothetical protein
MAETVRIRGTPATAKTRHPVGAFALVLVTLGIYYLVWYYKVNRELRDLGRATGEPERLGTSPLTSLLAVTIGWLVVVPPFVSWYRTFRRIRAAQEVSGADQHVSVALGFVLYVVGVFVLPIEVVYAQDELNRVWRAEAARRAAAT